MAIEIVGFPSYKMVDLSIATLNYQRVSIAKSPLEMVMEIQRITFW